MDAKKLAVQAANEKVIAAQLTLKSAFAAALPPGSRVRVARNEGLGAIEYIVDKHSYEPGYVFLRYVTPTNPGGSLPPTMVYLLTDYLMGRVVRIAS